MGSDDKFNDVKKSTLQFCVQGTFKAEDGTRAGPTDVKRRARWQSLLARPAHERVPSDTDSDCVSESCSREDFEQLFKAHLKDLEKSFKRDAKRFKTAAQLAEE